MKPCYNVHKIINGIVMQINLPLEKMTTSEKIDTMEIIWNSLCHDEMPLLLLLGIAKF